jgi:signal transduction histidine kinase
MRDSAPDSLSIFSWQVFRRQLVIFLPAAVLTGAIVVALTYQDLANDRTLHQQAADHLVELQAEIINKELKSVESDLLYLANQAVLVTFLSDNKTGKRELEEGHRLFCQKRQMYDQIRYLDSRGQERIRINYNAGRPEIVPEDLLQFKGDRYYFRNTIGLARGEVFFSPFDLNVEHQELERPIKPVIRLATPVFDSRGSRQGILVLNYLGQALLDKLARVSGTFQGSAWLLNRNGYFLRGPSPDDEWGWRFMLGHGRNLATYHPDAAALLTEGAHRQFQTGAGLFTYRTVVPPGPLPNLNRGKAVAATSIEADPDAGDPAMIALAFVPSAVLEARATLLLHRLLLLGGVVLALVFTLAWYLAYAGALRQRHESQLAESEARLRNLSSQLLTTQEDERRRLSRDLHDELGQVGTAVKLDLQRAGQAGDPDKKAELLRRALHGVQSLLDRIHAIAAQVRPAILDDLGLKDAVRSYLSEYQQQTGIVPQAELHFAHHDLPPAVSENIYRILQEALANVAKHARTEEVFVNLHVADGQAALTVRDGGVGFAPEGVKDSRLGLLGMRERAELLQGTFELKTAPGKGTEIDVVVPIPQPKPGNGKSPNGSSGIDSGRSGR